MNTFLIIGDSIHTFAILFLPITILNSKSYNGVSHKTQLLLFLVFATRYLDLFDIFISYYNSILKSLYISFTLITYLMGYWYNDIEEHDTFKSEILVFLAMLASVYLKFPNYPATEMLWAFSEYLEALAIIPQVYMTFKSKVITKSMIMYMQATACYKFLYLFNWVYRFEHENYVDVTSNISGSIFIGVYGISLIIFLCSDVATNVGKYEVSKKNKLSNSNVGQERQPMPDGDFLVMGNELVLKEKSFV